MAVWICNSCGFTKETRCKPKKCEVCTWWDFSKKEENSQDKKTNK